MGMADGMVTAYDIGDAAVKHALTDVSARVIVAAESSKLDRTGMAVVCGAEWVRVLVTGPLIGLATGTAPISPPGQPL